MGLPKPRINRQHVLGAFGVLLVVVGLALATRQTPEASVQVDGTADARVGTDAPNVDLVGLDGSRSSLADHRGKVVAIDFWATYCRPCIRSMPHLQELDDTLADDRFVLLSINVDPPSSERTEAVRQFLERLELTHPVFLDNGRASFLYEATRIPLLVLVDESGVVRFVFRGFVDPGVVTRAARSLVDS